MLRKFAVGLAALGALNATQVKALGLGEVTIHSALNQPLSAEIDLLQLRDLSSSQIISGLADADEFYLAGVKPTAVLSDIRFQLQINNGTGKILLTTREPIREPFLNFLVEVNWPSGRLVREYTVLLDPPVFTAKDLAPRPTPQAPTSSAMRPALGAAAPARTNMATTSGPTVAPSQFYVGPKDTLWNIALKTRPDRSVSPQQMMLAIQKTNPSAFIDNNINRLKSGVVLDIPNKQQISELSTADSVSEVKRQNSVWRGDNLADKTQPQGERLDAAKTSQESMKTGSQGGEDSQLRIVSKAAQVEEAPDAGKTVSADAAVTDPLRDELLNKNQELEEQLVVTLEGLDKVERDNEELFQRLEQLGEQMESLQRLVTLKDQQLSDLQNQVSQPTPAPAVVTPVAPAPIPAPAAGNWMTSPAVLGGAGAAIVALLGGLAFFMRKKKQDDEQAVEEALAILDANEADGQVGKAEAVGAAAVGADEPDPKVPETALAEVSVEEDPNDPFNLASDDDLVGGLDGFGTEDLESELGDDLEMDLRIDEPVAEDPDMEEFAQSLLSDDEYDIAVDEHDDAAGDEFDDIPDVDIDAPEAEESDELDFVLGETASRAEEPAAVEEQPEAEGEEDLLGGLDDILAESVVESEPSQAGFEAVAEEADEGDEDLLGDLDSILGEAAADSEESEEIAEAGEPEAISESLDLETVEAVTDDDIAEDEMLDELLSSAENSDQEPVVEPEPEMDDMALDALLDEDALDQAPIAEEVAENAALDVGGLDDIDAILSESATEAGEFEALAMVEEAPQEDIDAIMADLGADSIEDIQDADASIAQEVAESETDLEFIMDEMEEVAASAPETQSVPPASELVLEADGEDEADAGVGAVEKDVEVALDDDLDGAADDELEAELSLMLEDEGNALSLEETSSDEEDELDYLDGADEVGTKLDLARAYMDMDDQDGAKDILQEVLSEGNDQQKAEAEEMLKSIG